MTEDFTERKAFRKNLIVPQRGFEYEIIVSLESFNEKTSTPLEGSVVRIRFPPLRPPILLFRVSKFL